MGSPMFTTDNAAIVLIDHQDMTVGWIRSQPQTTTVNNVRMLARVGAELGVPHMVTSTMEDVIGTNIKDVQELAPEAYAARVKRGGTLNGFLDPAFVAAVKGLGRSNLILAGLTTDICLFHTARGAIDAGYEVQVVADACGSSSVSSDELTFDRLRALGRDHHRRQPDPVGAVHRLRHRAGSEGAADQHGRDHREDAGGLIANGRPRRAAVHVPPERTGAPTISTRTPYERTDSPPFAARQPARAGTGHHRPARLVARRGGRRSWSAACS